MKNLLIIALLAVSSTAFSQSGHLMPDTPAKSPEQFHKDRMISHFGTSLIVGSGIALDSWGKWQEPGYKSFVAPYIGINFVNVAFGVHHLFKFKKYRNERRSAGANDMVAHNRRSGSSAVEKLLRASEKANAGKH